MEPGDRKASIARDCDQLTQALIATARNGADILEHLEQAREHLARCPRCHEKLLQMARAIASEEYAWLLEIVRREDLGELPEPPSYPRFDLDFLRPPRTSIWRSAGQSIRELASGINLRVKVSQGEMAAVFAGLTGFLSSSVVATRSPLIEPARRNVRRGRVGSGQELTMPDSESNIRITLAVQAASNGKSHLSVEIRMIEPDEPVDPAQVRLHLPDGLDEKPTREGKVAFSDLEPGEYSIEIAPLRGRHSGAIWRMTVTIEPA